MKESEDHKKGLFYVVAIDVIVTFLSEIIVLVSFFLFYRLVAAQFSADVLGIYSLLRRVLAIFIPIALLGLSEGLSRYIAMASDALEVRKIIFNSGLILVGTILLIFAALCFNVNLSASIFFGDKNFAEYVVPFFFLLLGICLHTFVYSCLRGGIKIKMANVLQLINVGLLPIFLILFHKFQDIKEVLVYLGILQGVFAALFAVSFMEVLSYRVSYFSKEIIRKMFVYGVQRVPAPLASAGLISVGPIICSHFVSIAETGYLSLCLTLLVGVGGALSPIGIVLLPHISGLVRQGQLDKLASKLHVLVGGMIQMLMFVSFQFIIFSSLILGLWMGESFTVAAPVLAIVFLSLNAHGFYVVVRSVVDAVEVKPINSINSTISLICLVVLFFLAANLFPGPNLILKFALAFSISVNLLGYLTYRALTKAVSYSSKRDFVHLKYAFLLNLTLLGISLVLKDFITTHWAVWIFYEVIVGSIYMLALWKLKFEWVELIAENILRKLRKFQKA